MAASVLGEMAAPGAAIADAPDLSSRTVAVPLIDLRKVSRTYLTDGGVEVRALREVDLKIYPGEFVAIVGQSGSGKSTLMNILGCLDRPSAGRYLFAGRDVQSFDADGLAWLRREAFGFVFQSYNLLASETAKENVEVPGIYAGLSAAERAVRAESLLTTLGLGERLDHRPNQLSGGQQQRVSIARALMNGGKVILADEPTGALDSRSGVEVMALLEGLARKGHTVLLITHDQEVASHADRIVEFTDGSVVRDSGRSSDAIDPKRNAELAELFMSRRSSSLFGGFGEAIRMAMSSLHANLFRTVLTLLGIVIGVASVVAMLAIGEGVQASVVQQHQRHRHEHAHASACPCPESTAQSAVDTRIYGRGRDRGQRAERALCHARAAEQPNGALGQRGPHDANLGDDRGADAGTQLADGARSLLLA